MVWQSPSHRTHGILIVNELLKSSHVHRNTIIGNKNTNNKKKKVKKRDEVGKVGDLCEHLLE
jgi:hypothetical protein